MPGKSVPQQELSAVETKGRLSTRILVALILAILVVLLTGIWLVLYLAFPGHDGGWYLINAGLTLLVGDIAIIFYAIFFILRLERSSKKKS